MVSTISDPTSNEYVIIANDGTDAVTGTFAGFGEGGKVTVGTVEYQITYKGGTGNDVALKKGIPGTVVLIR